MEHDRDKIVSACRHTATLLDVYGLDAERCAYEWSIGATGGGGGPGQINAVSDPVGTSASSIADGKGDAMTLLYSRWLAARSSLAVAAAGLVGTDARKLRAIAARLAGLSRRATKTDDEQLRMRRLWSACCAFDNVIHETIPMGRDAAEKLLSEEAHHALAKDCAACESPTEQLRGGYCDACRKQKTRWEQLHPGQLVDEHRNEFKQFVVDGIASGLLRRPASPFSKIERRWVPEDEVVSA